MIKKIISDSGANVLDLNNTPFENIPLTIHVNGTDYQDDASLSVSEFVEALHQNDGKTSTACPSIAQWQEAFKGADEIYAVTITSVLSGSYNSAVQAAELYREDHPETRIHVIDSLSAGPEMELIIDKLKELIDAGLDFDGICAKINAYKEKTHLNFALESLDNLAKNGRISPAVAKVAKMLKIRVIGRPDDGKLTPIGKARGARKTISYLIRDMEEHGFSTGRVIIAHILNEEGADNLKQAILDRHPEASVEIRTARGLCTYYAQKGGLMVGYEA
ncbi:DegV family protein [Ligilactobacillus sp.]|uniref:DegV family protein n=1 Tax=Ligilactobacillus sp. TaxID=2767921 RepID=UPI002FE29783